MKYKTLNIILAFIKAPLRTAIIASLTITLILSISSGIYTDLGLMFSTLLITALLWSYLNLLIFGFPILFICKLNKILNTKIPIILATVISISELFLFFPIKEDERFWLFMNFIFIFSGFCISYEFIQRIRKIVNE
ncbi:MAG: hypothetical protein WBJ81_01830 [Rickettsiales bacterium]